MSSFPTLPKMFLIVLFFYSCNRPLKKPCKISSIKTLVAALHVDDNSRTYEHFVLIGNLSRTCLNSTIVVNAVMKYRDTVTIGRPVKMIAIFNSDKDFIPNHASQMTEIINRSCLVTITFDEKSHLPNDFVFYDINGEKISWGERWRSLSN